MRTTNLVRSLAQVFEIPEEVIEQIEKLEKENKKLRECVEAVSNDNWICGEYRDKDSVYFGMNEKQIAIKCLAEIKDKP
jgi:archaellum component FlaC